MGAGDLLDRFRVIGAERPMPGAVPCDLGTANSLERADEQLLEQLLGGEPEHERLRRATRCGKGRSPL